MLEFEWNGDKAQANFQNHGVAFELAKTVFKDPFAVERLDDREDYGEQRFIIIGMAEGRILLFCSLHRTRRAHSHYFSPEGNAR